jgi:exopolyphosphatase/guanosine-5'-triphosphate,3'-diphosphate pyrophosphatase
VTALLGRPPAGRFRVVVRDRAGSPVVIENAPLLDDGTPMPTRWWLVGRAEREAVSRLESAGGVAAAEASVPTGEVAQAHARYAAGRDATLPAGHTGPLPSGGVGGTRQGVKCLHAHLAAYLAGTGDPVGRWTAQRLDGQLRGPVAAVDCGTNSTRLLVAAPDGRQLDRRMTITRLGEGVDATGRLGEAAIERTLAALRDYRQVMDHRGVVRVRATATSAARDAANASDLLQPARTVLGVPLEVLSGTEEGWLSYAGATSGYVPAATGALVVDLGGGSTELIAPRHGAAAGVSTGGPADLAAVSIPAGCVRMTERFLHSDPPLPEEVAAARAETVRLVSGALASEPVLASAPRLTIGVAGTVTSLAALHLGLSRYEPSRTHHARLTRDDVEALLAQLSQLDRAQRRARRPLEPGRADVIVGGTAVLAALLEALGRDEIVVSETDSLDGSVASLLA